jgi:ribokinase
MAGITVVGSLNMDLVVEAERMPAAGETLRGRRFTLVPGGKGANQALAAARLGAKVALVGCVGDDPFADRLLSNLDALGVDLGGVRRVDGISTGVAAILVDKSGENRIIVIPGANGCVTPEDITRVEDQIASGHLLVLQLEVPMEAVKTAVQLATKHGTPVLLNPAPVMPLSDELLRQVTYLVLNESEARLLTGIDPVDEARCRQAAQALRARGVKVVVLTLGSRGATLQSEHETIHVPALKVDVVDTTAAGDAFVGAFAVALIEGRQMREVTRFACAAGTLAVTRLGAQSSIPTRAEVETMLGSGVQPGAVA